MPFNTSFEQNLSFSLFNSNHISLLRDDVIHEIISGNKWRKLKHIIDYAVQKNIKKIITFGGAYSNHVVALAYACNHYNIKSAAYIRGNEKRELNHYEKLCLDLNMELLHISREEFKNKSDIYYNNSQTDDTLIIKEGGDHELALIGCKEMLDDIQSNPDFIVLALGTGTTMEGLVQGVIEKNINSKIIGISTFKNNFDLDKRMSKYPTKHWDIMHGYERGKYGKIDENLIHYIKMFYDETGIKTEPIYTGKMLMAVEDLLQKKYFTSENKICLIHTGGLLSFPQ